MGSRALLSGHDTWIHDRVLQHTQLKKSALALLVVAKTKMGDKNIAQQALAELDKVRPDRQGLAYDRALVYLAIGNKEEALRWLEKSYADRDGANLSWINVEPILAPLHGEPRFEALVQKVIGPKSEAKP